MTPDWTPDILLAAVVMFVGLLTFAGWAVTVWPKNWPGADVIEEYSGPERRHG